MILKTLCLTFLLALSMSSNAQDLDQCEFIRSAINDLPEAGGAVNIPAGTYNCKSMIVIKKSNVRLTGAGMDQTVLRLSDFSHAPVLVIGDNVVVKNSTGDWVTKTRVSEIEVSDLTVDGNRAKQDVTKECGNGACDGDATNIRNNAITIRGASFVTLRRVTAKNSISGGLVTEKYSDHLHVYDFTSTGNYFDGFAGYQTRESVFEYMNLSNNRGAGISLDIDFNKNQFINGKLLNNGDVGIFARDTNDVLFENMVINKSGNHGVFLAASEHENTCANRNEFRSVSITESRGHGIHVSSPCKGNKITGESVIRKNLMGCYYVNPQTQLASEASVVCKIL